MTSRKKKDYFFTWTASESVFQSQRDDEQPTDRPPLQTEWDLYVTFKQTEEQQLMDSESSSVTSRLQNGKLHTLPLIRSASKGSWSRSNNLQFPSRNLYLFVQYPFYCQI